MGQKWPIKFSQTIQNPCNCLVFLHAANLRHVTDGFTSPPKEGMLRMLSPEKHDGSGFNPADLGTRGQRGNH
jgi:hypothetical protein